ncbi:hypothetical protein M2164_007952 [Streptomyces sp. SAI-208]|nr:hypothetical protein [Streptomyces sp. SAI-208]
MARASAPRGSTCAASFSAYAAGVTPGFTSTMNCWGAVAGKSARFAWISSSSSEVPKASPTIRRVAVSFPTLTRTVSPISVPVLSRNRPGTTTWPAPVSQCPEIMA